MAGQGMSLNLRKFDMRNIPQDAVCVFIGRRRTGKSTLVKDLLYHHQNLPIGTVISGTEEGNGFYGKLVPPIFIHNEFNPVILANFVKRQRSVVAQIQKEQQEGRQTFRNFYGAGVSFECAFRRRLHLGSLILSTRQP